MPYPLCPYPARTFFTSSVFVILLLLNPSGQALQRRLPARTKVPFTTKDYRQLVPPGPHRMQKIWRRLNATLFGLGTPSNGRCYTRAIRFSRVLFRMQLVLQPYFTPRLFSAAFEVQCSCGTFKREGLSCPSLFSVRLYLNS